MGLQTVIFGLMAHNSLSAAPPDIGFGVTATIVAVLSLELAIVLVVLRLREARRDVVTRP
jgi:hypothetical protein